MVSIKKGETTNSGSLIDMATGDHSLPMLQVIN